NATPHRIKAGSFRRNSEVIAGGNGIYILAVDELDAYLTATYGKTEDIRATQGRDVTKMQAYIKDFKGLLIFAGSPTEFWDGNRILQSGGGGAMMNPGYIWSRPFIKFWEITDGSDSKNDPDVVPKWVQGWWTVYDGNYYYYYFSGAGIVTYIKKKPNPAWTPPMTIGNQGKVTMTDHGLKIVWNPADGGQTMETVTRLGWSSETEMNGESDRYAQLFARKLK